MEFISVAAAVLSNGNVAREKQPINMLLMFVTAAVLGSIIDCNSR